MVGPLNEYIMPKRTRQSGEIPDTGLPKNAPAPHPGELLLEELFEPSDMIQAEAARRMYLPGWVA